MELQRVHMGPGNYGLFPLPEMPASGSWEKIQKELFLKTKKSILGRKKPFLGHTVSLKI